MASVALAHPHAVLHLVARVQDDDFADGKPALDLRFFIVHSSRLNAPEPRATAGIYDEHAPLAAGPEKGADWHLEYVRHRRSHNADGGAVAMTQTSPGFAGLGEVDDDIHALLFDPKGGDLGETVGLDQANAGL